MTSATPIADEDIYAFRPVPEAAPAPLRRRRVWPWVVGGLLLLALLAAAAGASVLVALLDTARHGVNVSINGETWDPIFVDPDHWWVVLLGVTAVLMVVLVVVPLVLLLALLAAALGIGIALLAVVVVAAVALSPLWLLVLLVWLALRRPARSAAKPAAAA